jgi:hypothetical protein
VTYPVTSPQTQPVTRMAISGSAFKNGTRFRRLLTAVAIIRLRIKPGSIGALAVQTKRHQGLASRARPAP